MAGLWHLSHHQMHNPVTGKVYVGAKAYFYEAASNNPLITYKDYSLGSQHPNPVVATGGVFPAVFLNQSDGFYRFRITDAAGVVINGTDMPVLPIIGPAEGGGGAEVPVDPDALFKTGDLKWRAGAGVLTGWARMNGRTIGSATSGATERANADTQQLYELLWQQFIDAICPVTGGRGVSASADFAANKPIGLPDVRGRVLAGLDDMGNSAAGRLSTNVFSVSGQGPTILGATAGAERHTMSINELPSHDHGGSTGSALGDHNHNIAGLNWTNNQGDQVSFYRGAPQFVVPDTPTTNANLAHAHGISAQGGGAAHNNTQPTFLATLYVKY